MPVAIEKKSPLRFLDPKILASLGSLELIARTVVEGLVTGLHHSPYLGFSLDFAEYQAYRPGDDIRRIDWKVYARSDRLYIKKYRGETNTRCLILLDCSRSMGFGSQSPTKWDYARYLAASLAYLASGQQDLVGFAAFDQGIRQYIGPRSQRRHLQMILRAMEELELGTVTSLGQPLHQLAEQMYRRGIAVVISDLLDEPAQVMDGIKHLRYQGQDVVLFHVLDEAELQFPFADSLNFVDLETGRRMHVLPQTVRADYLAALEEHNRYFRRECEQHQIDYILLNSAQPLDHALFSYLSRRAKPRLGRRSGA